MSSLVTRASRVGSRPPRLLWIVGHMTRVRSCTQTCGASHTNYRVSAPFFAQHGCSFSFFLLFLVGKSTQAWYVAFGSSVNSSPKWDSTLFSQAGKQLFVKMLMASGSKRHPSFVLLLKPAERIFLFCFVFGFCFFKPLIFLPFLVSLWCKRCFSCAMFSPFHLSSLGKNMSRAPCFSSLLFFFLLNESRKVDDSIFSGGLGES